MATKKTKAPSPIDPVAQVFAQAFTSKQVLKKAPSKADLESRMLEHNIKFSKRTTNLIEKAGKIIHEAKAPVSKMPEDFRKSFAVNKSGARRFHGARQAITWFPFPMVGTSCSDKFGYMSNSFIRSSSRLPFTTQV